MESHRSRSRIESWASWGLLALLTCAVAIPAPRADEKPEPTAELTTEHRLTAGFLAKRLCSGLWVNARERDDFLAHDILLGRELLDRLELRVDRKPRRVTAVLDGVPVQTALFTAGHGCTILPEGKRSLDLPPLTRPARSAREKVDWPMGERLPDTPLPNGVDIERIESALEAAFTDDPQPIVTRAVVVLHRGRLIAERYADGFDAASVQIGWSMGKSLVGALIGTAVERGWLDPQQPAPIAEWQVEGDPRAAVKLVHLLQMSGGLEFARKGPGPQFFTPDNDHFMVYFDGIDTARFVTEPPLEHAPGTVGRYLNCDPLALMRVLRETVEAQGEDAFTYPQRALFDRIGAFSMVLERDGWGNLILSGYDHGTARDYARFGQLHLDDGVWNGERILPEGWVKLVSTPAPSWPRRNYGGLFWVNGDQALADVPKDVYYAAGAFGQFTIVVPSHELVVVRMGYSFNTGAIRESVAQLLRELIAALPKAR